MRKGLTLDILLLKEFLKKQSISRIITTTYLMKGFKILKTREQERTNLNKVEEFQMNGNTPSVMKDSGINNIFKENTTASKRKSLDKTPTPVQKAKKHLLISPMMPEDLMNRMAGSNLPRLLLHENSPNFNLESYEENNNFAMTPVKDIKQFECDEILSEISDDGKKKAFSFETSPKKVTTLEESKDGDHRRISQQDLSPSLN